MSSSEVTVDPAPLAPTSTNESGSETQTQTEKPLNSVSVSESASAQPAKQEQALDADTNALDVSDAPQRQKRGTAFWATIFVVNIAYFVALLETSSISTPLPTIINDLHGTDFVWTGAAYNIAATAMMPTTGGLAQAFGRRPVMLASLLFFSVGSAMCGAANSDKLLVAGRTVQGAGGAGLFSMSYIILSDIVPLKERGSFNGILQLAWCIAAGIGPALGGALAQGGNWRWLFYLNLPIAGLAAILVVLFMHLKTPEGSFSEKLKRIDIFGNLLVMSSTVAVAIALTWGGSVFPWSSARVLVPLVLGAVGLGAFLLYEARWARFPLVPFHLLNNRTSLSGFLQNTLVTIPFTSLVFYLPIYFQACKGFGPLHSGTTIFALGFSVAPISVLAGLSVQFTGRYRPQLWAGWALAVPALALLGTTGVDTPLSRVVGYQVLAGVGFGAVFSGSYFPVLAAVPVTSVAHAVALFSFLRQFGQIWAITISGSILQNVLSHTLPSNFTSVLSSSSPSIGSSSDIAFAVIPALSHTSEPLLGEIREAFAEGLRLMWRVLAGFAGLGLVVSAGMRGLPLHRTTDGDWGIEEKEREREAREKEREGAGVGAGTGSVSTSATEVEVQAEAQTAV
ncbi:hypothetical protein M0805_006786 [Coniferiporia weirii]|nr:hypothetical protein M0805_006786 [Coniferiporia weirii]